jgi:hypothetical protein
MQEDDLTISCLFDALVTVTLSLVELKTLNGSELSNFINVAQDIQLKNVNQDDHSREKEVIIDLILAALASRFESMEKAATTILTLSDWPENRNQLAVFGNEEIALLLEHFHEILERSGCNHDAIMNQNGEWKDFKAFVFRHRTTVKFENFFIFPDLRCRFRNRIFLLELLLSFPLSSAVCERGFSAMKWIKSDWRSSLKPDMLRMLMYIFIEGPTVTSFNGQSVFDLWWSTGTTKETRVQP